MGRIRILSRIQISVANWQVVRRITQKGSLKSGTAGGICGQVSANFEQKGPKRGRTSEEFVSFLYILFPFTLTTILFFLKPKSIQKVKIKGWSNLFFSADDFLHRTGRKILSRASNNDSDPQP
jgi:hypothetical protein